MTDRHVNVKLEATVAGYNRAMGSATQSTKGLERQVNNTHNAARRGFSGMAKAAGLGSIGVTGALGAIVVSSVKSAAAFDVTMRQIAVATGAPASSIKSLSALALKMGQDTIFSAQDAGAAMLELAKGGLNEAQIRAGALASTLTLASAGGLDLASAAGYVVQGLSTFNLDASKAADVAAALAGGANASTASVQDMGMALSQVGPGAKLAGLSLQETTGVLAAFAQNGIKGSDAGTSLKTMLMRLVPQTAQQATAMERLHLKFTDAKGSFLGIDQIAQQLQDHLGKLSEAQRTSALNTIFGSDAARAASVLMKEGAKGVRDYTRATSDKTQADKLAAAATSGTAGALSQLSGSIDTAKLELGQALAPLITDLANHMTVWANAISTDVIPSLAHFIDGMEKGTGPGGAFADAISGVGDAAMLGWHMAKPFFTFIGDHPSLFKEVAKDAVIFAGALKVIGAVKKIPTIGGGGSVLGSAVSASKPLPVFVTNAGFNVPGGKGGPGAPTVLGKGTTVGEGRFSKILASNLTAQAVLMADVVLGAKATHSLKQVFNLHYDLSVNDAAKKFLAKIEDPGTDKVTKSILTKHYNAVFAGVAEAASTGNTKLLQKALNDTYAELHRNTGAIQKEILKETADNAKKNAALIAGGLQTATDAANSASQRIGHYITQGVGGGLGAAREKADDLSDALKQMPELRLHAPNFRPEVDDAYKYLLKIPTHKSVTITANLLTTGQVLKIGSVHSDGTTLYIQGTKGKLALADGGYVKGRGTARSDSIDARLSNGEYVVNAAATSRHRALLDLINGGGRFMSGSSTTQQVSNGGPTYNVQVTALPGENAGQSVGRALREAAYLS